MVGREEIIARWTKGHFTLSEVLEMYDRHEESLAEATRWANRAISAEERMVRLQYEEMKREEGRMGEREFPKGLGGPTPYDPERPKRDAGPLGRTRFGAPEESHPLLTLGAFHRAAVERLTTFRMAGSDGTVRTELAWWLAFLRATDLAE